MPRRDEESAPDRARASTFDLTVVVLLAVTPVVIEVLRARSAAASTSAGCSCRCGVVVAAVALPRRLESVALRGLPAGTDPQLAVLHPFHVSLRGSCPASAARSRACWCRVAAAACCSTWRASAAGGPRRWWARCPSARRLLPRTRRIRRIVRSTMMVPWGLLAIEALDGRALVAGLGLVAARRARRPSAGDRARCVLLGVYAVWLGRSLERGGAGPRSGRASGSVGGRCAAWLPTPRLVPPPRARSPDQCSPIRR